MFKVNFAKKMLSKALTSVIFSCINKNDYFIKETDIFGCIVI